MSGPRRNRAEGDRAMQDMELDAYLARIGLADRPDATAAGLALLQRAHRRAIPFENLDIPLGRGISLDPQRLVAKLVTARRGGYCFEQNALFLIALGALGFTARPLLARVWIEATGVPPRTHTFPLIEIDGEEWIADAGFGGSDVPPMRLVAGGETLVEGVRHRIGRDPDHGWMLTRDGERQYSFTTDRVWPADLAMANHWVATHPESRFVRMRIASIVTADGLVSLTGTRLSHGDGGGDIADVAAYRAALSERFGIVLTEGEAARLLAG